MAQWTATLRKRDPLQQRSSDHMHLGQQQSLILVGIRSQYAYVAEGQTEATRW